MCFWVVFLEEMGSFFFVFGGGIGLEVVFFGCFFGKNESSDEHWWGIHGQL